MNQMAPIVAASRNPPGTDALIEAYQQRRDQRAINGLLKQYERHIRSTSIRQANAWRLDSEDAVQMGQLGFVRAVELFDASFGASLLTYSRPHIIASARRLARQRAAVSVPSSWYNGDVQIIQRASRELRAEGVDSPSPTQISDRLRVYDAGKGWTARSPEHVARVLQGVGVASLDAPLSQAEGAGTRHDLFAAPEEERPDVLVEKKLDNAVLRTAIEYALQTLPPRRREMVRRVVLDEVPQTNVADEFGVTRQAVSEAMKHGIPLLRAALAGDPRVADYLN